MSLKNIEQFYLKPQGGLDMHVTAWGRDDYEKPIRFAITAGGMDINYDMTLERAEELADALNAAIHHAEAN